MLPQGRQRYQLAVDLKVSGWPVPIISVDTNILVSARVTSGNAGQQFPTLEQQLVAGVSDAILRSDSITDGCPVPDRIPVATLVTSAIERCFALLPAATRLDLVAIRAIEDQWDVFGLGAFRVYHIGQQVRHAWYPDTQFLSAHPGGDPDAEEEENQLSSIQTSQGNAWKSRMHHFVLRPNQEEGLVVVMAPTRLRLTDLVPSRMAEVSGEIERRAASLPGPHAYAILRPSPPIPPTPQEQLPRQRSWLQRLLGS